MLLIIKMSYRISDKKTAQSGGYILKPIHYFFFDFSGSKTWFVQSKIKTTSGNNINIKAQIPKIPTKNDIKPSNPKKNIAMKPIIIAIDNTLGKTSNASLISSIKSFTLFSFYT